MAISFEWPSFSCAQSPIATYQRGHHRFIKLDVDSSEPPFFSLIFDVPSIGNITINNFIGRQRGGPSMPGSHAIASSRACWHVQRKGAAPLSGADEQTASAISAYVQ
jgi:hypothetical protein